MPHRYAAAHAFAFHGQGFTCWARAACLPALLPASELAVSTKSEYCIERLMRDTSKQLLMYPNSSTPTSKRTAAPHTSRTSSAHACKLLQLASSPRSQQRTAAAAPDLRLLCLPPRHATPHTRQGTRAFAARISWLAARRRTCNTELRAR